MMEGEFTPDRAFDIPVFTAEDIARGDLEDIYQKLLRKGNGGTTIRTTAAPALSTQFVRSQYNDKATAQYEGAFAEIIYPSHAELEKKRAAKHLDIITFGYQSCRGSDAFPAGFGERSARALSREENVYQLKGTFPSAALNFAKLRASVEARDGDVESVNSIFAQMWNISEDEADMLPKLHLDGSEATRLSALDDRAYHALAGHPGHHGGYRVDMATLPPDTLGDNVPINWPRVRTSLKAIALMQTQGDAYTAELIRRAQAEQDTKFTMSMVRDSQPAYIRPRPWEIYMAHLLKPNAEVERRLRGELDASHVGFAMGITAADERLRLFFERDDINMRQDLASVARTVSRISTQALSKTISIMMDYGESRAMIEEHKEEDYELLDHSSLSMSLNIPTYKLTRTSLYRGLKRQELGRDPLPDVASHGKARIQLDLSEFREARLNIPLDIPGALNMAVYLAVMNPAVQMAAYALMIQVPAPDDGTNRKVAIRLRRQELYDDPHVRRLGGQLFGDIFMNTFELLLRNMTSRSSTAETAVKMAIWEFLSSRCRIKRVCPVIGGWKDLIMELRTCSEGWALYYWARVTIGRRHHTMSDGILAPMAAGETIDFLTMMKRTIQEKTRSWANYYSGAYRAIEGKLEDDRESRKKLKKKADEISKERKKTKKDYKYIPPNIRKLIDLEMVYDADEILNREKGYTAEQYRRMVEMQSKSKLFAALDVFTSGSQIAVGITDDKMLSMLIEFYQARWFSLEVRIEKFKKKGEVFHLGIVPFPEHPWGEVRKEFPSTHQDMLVFMGSLDHRAWTIHPEFLQEKLRKSLSELWEDITAEVAKLTLYIREVCEGVADEQDEVNAQEGIKDAMIKMLGTTAIPIPAFGYRAPSTMPQKAVTVFDGEHERLVQPKRLPFISNDVQAPPPHIEDEGDLDDDDDEGDFSTFMGDLDLGGVNMSLEVIPIEYISLRRIWHIAGYPTLEDAKMRMALGVSADHDLDAQHYDDLIGPTIPVGDETSIQRRWKKREPFIQFRLGQIDTRGVVEDM